MGSRTILPFSINFNINSVYLYYIIACFYIFFVVVVGDMFHSYLPFFSFSIQDTVWFAYLKIKKKKTNINGGIIFPDESVNVLIICMYLHIHTVT